MTGLHVVWRNCCTAQHPYIGNVCGLKNNLITELMKIVLPHNTVGSEDHRQAERAASLNCTSTAAISWTRPLWVYEVINEERSVAGDLSSRAKPCGILHVLSIMFNSLTQFCLLFFLSWAYSSLTICVPFWTSMALSTCLYLLYNSLLQLLLWHFKNLLLLSNECEDKS